MDIREMFLMGLVATFLLSAVVCLFALLHFIWAVLPALWATGVVSFLICVITGAIIFVIVES